MALLAENREVLPELLVEPEGLETETASLEPTAVAGEPEDLLLGLFRTKATLPADAFLQELRKQRGLAASVSA